ncbi:MAG: N-acetylmuramoyl-L-alanine amidase [Phycisphaerae bacterium]|nr:N-acetylmuramoyl-L-alanine amidase [Phycisphaerae bacterium]
MVESRMAKTLLVLLATMTFGAITLWLMSGEPIPPADHAAVIDSPSRLDDIIFNVQVPLRPARWRHIVVHGAGSAGADVAKQCHFVLGQDGQLEASAGWKLQIDGQAVSAVAQSFNSETISICLVGDFCEQPPSDAQFQALVALTRLLQAEPFNIGPGHVYLRTDLDAFSDSPGPAFPTEAFAAQLHRAAP